LTPGGGAERAQVSRVDAVARDLRTGESDVGLALAVQPLAADDPRREQAELLQLSREVGRNAGALAQLGQVDLVHVTAEARRAAPGAVGRRSPQLLTDHPERQELVTLEAQDRRQPLDVRLREEAIATARALRVQQALILEIADLRDRDVRKLLPQALAD